LYNNTVLKPLPFARRPWSIPFQPRFFVVWFLLSSQLKILIDKIIEHKIKIRSPPAAMENVRQSRPMYASLIVNPNKADANVETQMLAMITFISAFFIRALPLHMLVVQACV
jgi:hypothetical protein